MIRLPEVMNADDVRVVQFRQHTAFAVEPFREPWVAGQLVGEQLQRDQTVEMRLAGLEDESHPAAADELENLQLRKRRRDELERGDLRGGSGRRARLPRGGTGHDAFGAEPLRRSRRNDGAAFWTVIQFDRVTHNTVLLRRVAAKVT